jgi:hypothetical protein
MPKNDALMLKRIESLIKEAFHLSRARSDIYLRVYKDPKTAPLLLAWIVFRII